MSSWNAPHHRPATSAENTPAERFIRRCLLVLFLLLSMPIGPVLLLFRWYCTDFSSACRSFEDFLTQCIDPEDGADTQWQSARSGPLTEI